MTTNSLVSSHDVNGTNVYSPAGDKVGHIDHLMIDKSSGNIPYAVMQFGGFLGIGEDEYPVPWKRLSYDVEKEGFVTDITKEDLEGAPRSERHDWIGDRAFETRLHDHYAAPYYWI